MVDAARPVCHVCTRSFAQNTCPKCRCRYCSLACYKSHSSGCTEAFYRDQAVTQLKGTRAEDSDKRKVMQILQRFHDQLGRDDAALHASGGLAGDGDDDDGERGDEEGGSEEEDEEEGEDGELDLSSILSEQTLASILNRVGPKAHGHAWGPILAHTHVALSRPPCASPCMGPNIGPYTCRIEPAPMRQPMHGAQYWPIHMSH